MGYRSFQLLKEKGDASRYEQLAISSSVKCALYSHSLLKKDCEMVWPCCCHFLESATASWYQTVKTFSDKPLPYLRRFSPFCGSVVCLEALVLEMDLRRSMIYFLSLLPDRRMQVAFLGFTYQMFADPESVYR